METNSPPHSTKSTSLSMSTSPILKRKGSSPKKNSEKRVSMKTLKKKPENRRKNTFRAEGVNWLLTFPQCSISKQEAVDKITSKVDLSVKSVVVGQEKHADGNPHLHIIVCLEKRLRTRSAAFWDFVCGKHGDYRVIQFPKKAYEYVTKEDKEPLIFGSIPKVFLDSKMTKSAECAKMIMSGSTVESVVQLFPDYGLVNLQKLLTFKSYVTNVLATASLQHLSLPIKYNGTEKVTGSIVDWLNGNLKKERSFKQKQLWLFGPPDTKKTSLLMKLATFLRIYTIPLGEDFYDTYSDDAYDLIIADEYKCQKTITWINAFVQGGLPLNLRIKGGQIMKFKNLPVIIASNHSIVESYSKANYVSVDALKTRFTEIEVVLPIDIDNIMWGNEKDEE